LICSVIAAAPTVVRTAHPEPFAAAGITSSGIDHHDVWRLLRVGVRDEAPFHHAELEGLQVVAGHHVEQRPGKLGLLGRVRAAGDPERQFGVAGHRDRSADDARGFDAGHLADAILELKVAFAQRLR
jgi:hypothetical protein